ncbi:MAG: HAD family hydrolase [Verrucomicrobiota bacterium]
MTRPAPDQLSPAVFLDRDGTIMRDVEYCSDPKQVEIFSGVPEALVRLKQNGYKLIIISNQSGIGRGYFSEEQFRSVQDAVGRKLAPAVIDAVYYCRDKPDGSSIRRKPSPAMVFEAQRDHGIDLIRSFFVGDKAIDIQCGRNAGVRTILVQTGYGLHEENTGADWVACDFTEATDIILEQLK